MRDRDDCWTMLDVLLGLVIVGLLILAMSAALGAETRPSVFSTGVNQVRLVEGIYPFTGPEVLVETPEHRWVEFASTPFLAGSAISVDVHITRSWARGWHNPGPELVVGCYRKNRPGIWPAASGFWPDAIVTTDTTRNITLTLPAGFKTPCYVTVLWEANGRVVGKSVTMP